MAKEKQAKSEKGQAAPAPKKGSGEEKGAPPRLALYYKKEIIAQLMKRFEYKSSMQVPRLEKISINVGVGLATQDAKILDTTVKELEAITGQKVAVTKAKRAISNFKLREGIPIGCRVTLRRARMYEFLDRFITVAVPRMRDFRGLPTKSFDGRGNYTLGIKEQMIFPEIDYDKVERIHGMDITIVTDAKRDDLALALLREMGMPFRGEQPVLVG